MTHNCRCAVLYVDYEGRSDGESMKRILTVVKPRQIVSSCVNCTQPCTCGEEEVALKRTEAYLCSCLACTSLSFLPCSSQILVHGMEKSTSHLKGFCHTTLALPEDKVFTPRCGECVNVTSGIRVLQVCVRVRVCVCMCVCMCVFVCVFAPCVWCVVDLRRLATVSRWLPKQ